MALNLIFYQMIEAKTSTFTYLLGDKVTREAILIDSVLDTVERDLRLIEELELRLRFVVDTHIHADHITGAGRVRAHTGARSAVSCGAQVDCVDLPLEDGQILSFGEFALKAISTPGHTNSCMSFHVDGKVFTGDALLIRGTGRTDFQQGSSEKLYDSIVEKLFRFDDDTEVYPAHDYRGQMHSTIGLEKKFNPRVGQYRSKAEFVKIMNELKLADPEYIHEAVPANLKCGRSEMMRAIQPQWVDGRPEVSPEQVSRHTGKFTVIDVRRADEFNAELGHISGAKLLTLGEELLRGLESMDCSSEIVFVCRSGGRSGQATQQAMAMGFDNVANMVGGMLRWNELHLPVERNEK